MSKWWLGSPYNWRETGRKKQLPPSPTSTGLNPSWRNLTFNNIVDPTDNIIWVFKFCSGPGFNSMSPDVKSFVLETQCLLVLLVDFVILWLFKQKLVIHLLFCKGFLAVTLFSFKKLPKKTFTFVQICYIPYTITYSESLSHQRYNLDDLGVYFLRIHLSWNLTFLFFMDLIIVSVI